jgi:thymidylate kinase
VKDTRAGLHVAFLGIDGVGKTTLVREIAELARHNGRPVRVVSWRAVVDDVDGLGTPRYAVDELRHLWVQSFRSYFGGATLADLSPVPLPVDFADLDRLGGTEYLNGVTVVGVDASGPMAAGWIEFAANSLLHEVVITRLVADGYLVLQESYGYKHPIKLFAFAEQVSAEGSAAAAVGREVTDAFFGGALRPDLGVYVAGSPALALKWRRAQSGQVGTFESMATVGQDVDSSFVRLQEESVARFDAFAEAHSWLRVEVIDAPREENRRRILEVLSRTPLGSWLTAPAGAR